MRHDSCTVATEGIRQKRVDRQRGGSNGHEGHADQKQRKRVYYRSKVRFKSAAARASNKLHDDRQKVKVIN